MKKIILLISLVGVGLASQAQVTFGFKAGFNGGLATEKVDLPEAENESPKLLPSFHVGGFVDLGLSESFSIQPGLQLNGRGSRVEHEGHHDDLRIYSLDVPVNFLYRKGGFFVGAGPSLGYGLSAKVHAHEEEENEGDHDHDDDKVKFGSKLGELKPINFGLNATAGYELKNGLFVSASYLADLSNWSNKVKETQRYSFFSVSLGFRLGKKD
jgi:hypothetical protein